METFAVIKRHPVINGSGISLSAERGIALLIADRIGTLMRDRALCLVAGYEIRRNQLFSVLIEIKVLRAQIDLDIGRAEIRAAERSRLLGELGRALRLGPRRDGFAEPALLGILIHLPAIGTASYGDGCPPAGFEAFRFVIGIVLGCEILNELVQFALIQLDAALAVR